MADVVATLANYGGIKGIIIRCDGIDGSDPTSIWLAAVKYGGVWHLCDAYRQSVFINRENHWASISEILKSDYQIRYLGAYTDYPKAIQYKNYFESLKNLDFDLLYRKNRSAMQDPFARFRFFLND